MNTKYFPHLGGPLGQATRRATDFLARFILGDGDKSRLHTQVAAIVTTPSVFLGDDLRQGFAKALLRGSASVALRRDDRKNIIRQTTAGIFFGFGSP